jgi:dTDP-glucose 4,6-dehydratase
MIFITGGCGFIGSELIRYILSNHNIQIINIDKLTYAGNTESLKGFELNPNYIHEVVDICNAMEVRILFKKYKPNSIIHLAAESHVDRSIENADEFINTNIIGTFKLLEESRYYFDQLDDNKKNTFKFLHVSTDEVFGDLGNSDDLFHEETSYKPSSPYAASKAGSDHLVRAWGKTYGLPTLITNCSNNYGPFQFPEKLIPHVILNALKGLEIPVYGDGLQIRDWLYVEDHAKALFTVLHNGNVGETYNIGGHNQIPNIEVVKLICKILDELVIDKVNGIESYSSLITFVKDRPGHDIKYAIDASKAFNSLNWMPEEIFETGLKKTVSWYLENTVWWENILSGNYQLNRLGDNNEH